ncbi:hypothetical protein BLA24_10395, partial [Streptomyces cinnamoneus]
LAGSAGGPRPRTLPRSALYRALRDEATRRGIPVEYGKRLVATGTGPRGTVTALFADGSRAEGDLVVGADGIHSRTRTLLDPPRPAPATPASSPSAAAPATPATRRPRTPTG